MWNKLKTCQVCDATRKTNPIWDIWDQKSLTIPNTNFHLSGFSIAAFRTNFYLKELNIMLDAGMTSNYFPDYIFVTHLHTDHIANIGWHFDPANNEKNMQVFVPLGFHAKRKIENLMEASHPMSGNFNDPGFRGAYVVEELSSFSPQKIIKIGAQLFRVEIISCFHTINCIGYGLIEQKHKLKEEYFPLKGKDRGVPLKLLKEAGVEITEIIENPFFLYLGDTNKDVLLNPALEKYTTIMIECTFLIDEDEERAILTKHMHWNHLHDYILLHPQILFILYHFSTRYTRHFIQTFFENLTLSNVIIWNNN